MNDAQFEDLVDRHGGDLTTWPSALRAPAEALLETSAIARMVIAREQALKAVFAAEPMIRAPEGLALRIFDLAAADDAAKASVSVAAAAATARRPHLTERLRAAFTACTPFVLQPAAVLAICFAIGLLGGTVFGGSAATRTAQLQSSLFAPIVR